MDAKLKQILELALRADTGEGESAAALAAARRLVAKHGMELLSTPVPERVVYNDKIIYRKPTLSHTLELTIRMPARFHHTMIERIFLDAQDLACEIELISCKTLAEAIMSGTVIQFKVMGTKSAVDAYNRNMDSYVDEMNRKLGPATRTVQPPQPSEVPIKPKSKGWFSKLFGG